MDWRAKSASQTGGAMGPFRSQRLFRASPQRISLPIDRAMQPGVCPGTWMTWTPFPICIPDGRSHGAIQVPAALQGVAAEDFLTNRQSNAAGRMSGHVDDLDAIFSSSLG